MSNPKRSYVVKIKVGGATSTRIWHAPMNGLNDQPLTIGHPMRWVLERTDSGVTVRNVSEAIERAGAVPKASSSQPSKSVSHAAIEKGAEIDLPELRSVKTGYQIEIRPVEMFLAAHATHPEGSGHLKIYACRGDWTLSSKTLSCKAGHYDGSIEHLTMFRIQPVAENLYRIKSKSKDLKLVATGAKSGGISIGAGECRDFSHDALQGHTLRIGEFEWKIEAIREADRIAAADVAPIKGDIEREQFKRASRYALSAVLAFLMLSALWPKADPDEVLAPQATRLVLKKPKAVHKFMTAAAQGDRKSRDTSLGNTPSKKAHGTQMAKSRPSKKRSSPTVAKAKTTGAKKVAKVQPKKHQLIGHKNAPKRPSPVVAHAAPAPHPKPHAKPGAPAKSVAKRPPAPNPQAAVQKTALAQAFSGAAFKNTSRTALSGGMTTLLKSGKLAGGSGGAEGLSGGRALHGSAQGGGGAGGGVGTRGVEIAALGGGEGLYGIKGPGYGRGSHAAVSGQGKSFVSVDLGESDVDEGLTREQVAAVIQRHMSEVRYCYEAARLRNPDTEGKLPVAFAVGPVGKVVRANAQNSSVGDSKLESCLLKRLVTWQFPHPKGGVTVGANWPFVFKALGR